MAADAGQLAPEERAALLLRKYRAAFDPFRPYHECRLYALLADGATLLSSVVLRDGTPDPERWAVRCGQGLSGMAAITGVPNLYNNAHQHPHTLSADRTRDQARGEQAMIAPLKAVGAERPVAVLSLNRLGMTWWPARLYAQFLALSDEMRDDWFRSQKRRVGRQ